MMEVVIILAIIATLLFFTTLFILYLAIKQRMLIDTELKVAKFASEFSWVEVEYCTMIDENKLHIYPNIREDVAQVSNINNFIAENFFDWHKKIKVAREFNKSNSKLYIELKDCTDDSIKELYNRKNETIANVYAMQHPIQHFLYKLILGDRIIIKMN